MLKIEKWLDNKVLRDQSLEISINDITSKKYNSLIEEMKREINSPEEGKITLWIAAPQIWINIRLIVIREVLESTRKGEILKDEIYEMINPNIFYRSEHSNYDYEGCLSVPWVEDKVTRSSHIKVEFLTKENKREIKEYYWLNARVIQHEVDHLNWILFTDYVRSKNYLF